MRHYRTSTKNTTIKANSKPYTKYHLLTTSHQSSLEASATDEGPPFRFLKPRTLSPKSSYKRIDCILTKENHNKRESDLISANDRMNFSPPS